LAVKYAPDFPLVYRFRADYEAAEEKDVAALADYSRAVQLNPQSAEALSGRSWLLTTTKSSTLRNPVAAVADATKACDLTAWNDPDMLSVLAGACAATGDFANAQKWQADAVTILDGELDRAADAEAKRLLALYQAQKPYAPPQ
jgi:Tfp pilus assembly protein PilF